MKCNYKENPYLYDIPVFESDWKIIQNAQKCLKCGEIIVSRSVHDYQTCSCGTAMVDGGPEYFRQNVGENIESMNIDVNMRLEDAKKLFVWGTYGKEGNEPLQWKRIVDCTTNHLEAIVKIPNIDVNHAGYLINEVLKDRKTV